MTVSELAERLLNGDRRALARALSWIENASVEGAELLAAVYPRGGRAHIVGITGAGGSGKSTLVNALTAELRRREQRVGIIAVDPSSPFTLGAILGDRIRMQDVSGDPGVFIRSMASRGTLGGISATTGDAVAVMDAAGFDRVLVETLGAGQDEVEIARTAQTTVLVLTPNSGDEIQTLKAGIIEIADILVVNKADLPGADNVANHLRSVQSYAPTEGWVPPILRTSAVKDEGVPALVEALDQHRAYLADSGEAVARAAAAARHQIEVLTRDALMARLIDRDGDGSAFERAVGEVVGRRLDPRSAALRLVEKALA